MSECTGNVFVLNGELQPTEMFNNSMVYEGDSIYEILRIIKGRPVFFTDHIERLKTSVSLQKRTMLVSVENLKKDIISLIKLEKQKEINLKIVFNYNRRNNYLIYLIKSIYPTADQYKRGVKGTIFYAERKDPESKVIDHRLRSEIYNKLLIERAYEAILVTKNGHITEGSRSNIFFIKRDRLFTAPDEFVLNGITRKQILKICSENGIDIDLTLVKADTIKNFDCVFMTGTSPVILPFNCIDNDFFKVGHHLITSIREIYLEKVRESLDQFSNNL